MIIERTSYWPKPGKLGEVIAKRQQACVARLQMGLPPGDVFVEGETADTSVVHWECRFDNEEHQKNDLAARKDSDLFNGVRREMGQLIDDFKRSLFRQARSTASVLRDTPLDGVPIVPREMSFRSDGLELKGYLYLPPGDGPFPCLVTNHGSTINQGTTDVCRPGSAAVLMQWGIASFLPHRRGYGNSPGTPWREEVNAEFGSPEYDRNLSIRIDREADDVVAAQGFASDLPEIDSDHVGVIGSSFGGIVTLLSAAKCEKFRCAVEFAGAAMNWERTPTLRKTMTEAAHRLTRPIFFVQADNDYSTGPTRDLAASLEGTNKVVQHKIYPAFGLTKDEGHILYGSGAAVWGRDVRLFLDRWL